MDIFRIALKYDFDENAVKGMGLNDGEKYEYESNSNFI